MHGLMIGLPIIVLVLAAMVFGPRIAAKIRPEKPGTKRQSPTLGARKVETKNKIAGLPQVYQGHQVPPPPQSLAALGQARQKARREGQGPSGTRH